MDESAETRDEIIRVPSSEVDLTSPALRRLYREWHTKRGDNEMPPRNCFDLLDHIEEAKRWMILDIMDDGKDAHFRFVGSDLVAFAGIEPSGSKYSQMTIDARLSVAEKNTLIIMERVINERKPVQNGPVAASLLDKTYFTLESLSVPLGTPDGNVEQIVISSDFHLSSEE